MLTVDKLSKSFGKKTVLDNISVQLTHGVYGLLGPNGSGKTTFMRCVAGISHVGRCNDSSIITVNSCNAPHKGCFPGTVWAKQAINSMR